MAFPFEIRALHPFTKDEIWPIIAGYETGEIYTVQKTETDQDTLIVIHLAQLETPFRDSYYEDFSPEECERYLGLLPEGYCFGAYSGERLIGFAIGEPIPAERLARVWEFHVLEDFRGRGVGRALMERVIEKARGEGLPTIMLETQNTNVKAIRFYRRMRFKLESIDLTPAHYRDANGKATGQAAFYMKLHLKD